MGLRISSGPAFPVGSNGLSEPRLRPDPVRRAAGRPGNVKICEGDAPVRRMRRSLVTARAPEFHRSAFCGKVQTRLSSARLGERPVRDGPDDSARFEYAICQVAAQASPMRQTVKRRRTRNFTVSGPAWLRHHCANARSGGLPGAIGRGRQSPKTIYFVPARGTPAGPLAYSETACNHGTRKQ